MVPLTMADEHSPATIHREMTLDKEGKDALDRRIQADLEKAKTHATYIPAEVGELPLEHRQYLINRHGTADLDPVPYADDADPYNWPGWKKTVNLVLVAFHAMMGTFNAAAVIPAFASIAAEFKVSLQQASYITSLQIAILGVGPFFWRPLSNRYGRRPIFLVSLIAACVCNIGCAVSHSYGAMAACRALASFFISPAIGIGSAVVTESFFKKERGKYIGVWTFLVTMGVPTSPFLFGFLVQHIDYRWIYWVLAITHGVQFILYIFFGPETRYIRYGGHHEGGPFRQEYFNFGRIDPTPFKWSEFIAPLRYFAKPCVLIPACSYSMAFNIGGVLTTIEIPQLFGEKFGFGPQAVGLQFSAVIIGTVIGEQMGGISSDKWMALRTRKLGHRPQHEYRLWLSYPGTILTIIGVVVFLIQVQNATEGQWNVTPDVGIAIASVGVQIVTTVMVTYAVDCYHEDAASVGVFITFVRQMWAFIGPFWYTPMFENVGLAGSAGIGAALLIGVGLIPVIFNHALGRRWRNPEA